MTSFKCSWPPLMLLLLLLSISTRGIDCQNRQCNTPDNRVGTCVNVENCPLISSILREAPKPLPKPVQDYITKAYCGQVNNKHGLCCREPSFAAQPGSTVVPIVPASSNGGDGGSGNADITTHRNLRLLPSTDCGPLSTNKLSGGEITSLGEFAWMALLRYNTPDGLRTLCGGSIINKRYILTAAHCVSRLRSDTSLYSVLLGEHDTRTDPDCFDGVCNPARKEFFFDRIVSHDSYNTPRYANDIALVRLSQDISFAEDYIKPVCLPTTTTLVNQELRSLILAGWGTTEAQVTSPELLKARLSVVPLDDCRAAHRRVTLDDRQICVKGSGIVDSCKGDSGGPLMFPYQLTGSARYVQFGVVSAGAPGCGEAQDSKPGIYVKVQRYMSWILDNIQE